MTTYGRLLQLIATLQHIKADLKSLALHNTHDLAADQVFLQGAAQVNDMIRELEQRRHELLSEEPQFAAEHVTSTDDNQGGTDGGKAGTQ